VTHPRLCLVAVAALGFASRLTAADPFKFKDGDRVVLLGSTLIEREQKYGYWELLLTLKNRDKDVTFRNLGWSGDTVFGEARNGFDTSPKGFERLVDLTLKLKPTVIVICYGHNESFEGKAGVAKFKSGVEKLLDSLAPAKARVLLMTPTPFEKIGPVADPDSKNYELAGYRTVVRTLAYERELECVDLFKRVLDSNKPTAGSGYWSALTDNGLHLSHEGYARTAPFLVADDFGDPAYAPAVEWTNNPAGAKLRQKIVEKNELFFHRWRPQNETYLFGFRKHEQGKNAAEVAEFDPLVAAAEKEIAEIRKKLK
jgi:lysophospholipase L1-like esterase